MEQNYKRSFSKGEIVFQQGEPGECAYFIKEGTIEISIQSEQGPIVIANLSAGDLFGEMALIDGKPRSATARAIAPTQLTEISLQYLEEHLKDVDDMARLLLKVVIGRYREMRGCLEHVMQGHGFPTPQHSTATGTFTYSEDAERAASRLEAENALGEAMAQHQFELFYQPILALQQDNRIAGCEALIRWHHPERGYVSPGDFISLAEETGHIIPMGRWIIEEACGALGRYRPQLNGQTFYMSINLSGRQFESSDLIEDIRHIFEQTGTDPEQIKLEITESLLMGNPLRAIDLLTRLKELGAEIAIDDFGTGYSSFSYLHRFPIDTLKIDQSFVSTMESDAKSMMIVRSLVKLSKAMGMKVIAEGVETQEQMAELRTMGCDYGQGYLFAKPLPEKDFLDFLHN